MVRQVAIMSKAEMIELMEKVRDGKIPNDKLNWLMTLYWNYRIIRYRLFGREVSKTIIADSKKYQYK